jgi:hypothetical protein
MESRTIIIITVITGIISAGGGGGTTTPDPTVPVIEANIDGRQGRNGWYTSEVVDVSWKVNDRESRITSRNGCDPTTITEDTTGTKLTCEAKSAGGTNSESVTIKKDATPPVITAIHSGIGDGAVYAEQLVPSKPICDASDDVLGIDSEGCKVSGYSATVGSHTITFTATDNAGNTATAPEEISYQVVVG